MTFTVENPGPLIAFSGSRTFTDRPMIEELMRRLVKRWPHCLIRVGDAKRGVDWFVAHEATRWGKWPDVQECYWPPEPATKRMRWEAAHERNGRVIEGADFLIAIFAPGERTSGTSDAVKQARARHMPVYIYHEGRWDLPVEDAA